MTLRGSFRPDLTGNTCFSTSTSLSNGIVIGTDAVAWDKVTDENGDVIIDSSEEVVPDTQEVVI